ncbi:39S ribosomal protein L32, mitochondrial [Sitodiplosis mosellana]|uniref:39S ribosomal protein L32, mitochondrial n=1 Tax=Sitodiplosis mosellana TaxID=263140 RepID=UPI0024441E25|nr:39S ribosomal protein L32, mitochondrial [Sitodiplosis mosellana]
MSLALLLKINRFIQRIENVLPQIFGRGFPPEPMCVVACPNYMPAVNETQSSTPFSLKDLIGDGILWAVPKHRKSIERRLKAKYGHPRYVMKIYTPKTTLRICVQCGHDHEVGVLCPNCYKRVMDETQQMQQIIEEKLGLNPDDKEVVVLYDGERDKPAEFWEGKRVVEMEKPRPTWFSKNLLQKTTQPAAKTTEVKPTNLG